VIMQFVNVLTSYFAVIMQFVNASAAAPQVTGA